MLRYLKCLVFLKKKVDSRCIENVLEIGGGFGTLGEIFLKSPNRDYFYLNVDIPPLAAVATHYLQQVFGPDRVADYLQTRDMAVIDIEELQAKNIQAAVICPWQLPRVQGRFQLFVNTSSFQEMEPEVVGNYVAHLDRLVTHYFLLRNSRYGKKVAVNETDIGVKEQVKQEHYKELFAPYTFVALDARVFGQTTTGGFASEVMIFRSW